MPFDALFGWANAVALVAWGALIALPRRPWLLAATGLAVPLVLCLLYAVLVLVYFFRVEGGGFGSLEQVGRLMASPPVLLAGWVHYLAFDLLVGSWIARQCDALDVPRTVQAPVLLATFMFGPLGWLLFQGLRAARPRQAPGVAA